MFLMDTTESEKDTQRQALEVMMAELLKDRRSERRTKLILRVATLITVLVLAWVFSPHHGISSVPTGPHTAVVEINGEIALDTEASARALTSALKDAYESPTSVAVMLRINSPGGSPVQAGMVNDEIRRLKALHKKKTYAVVEEICASGAYYIAVAADEIYVDKASLVGSIGVLMDGFGFTGIMEKLGIERRLITAGENKGMLDPFSKQNEKERAYAQALIDQIHEQFIAVVKEGRGERLKITDEIFSGLFWNGDEAVSMGLVDGLGNADYVARELIETPEMVDYTPHENVAERLAKRFGAAVGSSMVRALSGAAVMH